MQKQRNLDATLEKEAARILLLSGAKRAKKEVVLQKAERDWRHENCSAKQGLEEGNGAFSLRTLFR